MEPTSERRFDANFAMQILLEIAHEQSLEKLLQELVERVMASPHIVCAQVWLIEKGDLCSTCPRRPECPDQSRCLHLAAAKAKPMAGPRKGFGRLDPETAREPLGVPPIGSVVVSGQQRAVPDLNKRPVSPLDPDWMREEGIRGYTIDPISYKGEALGAIITATREPFQEELRPWGSIVANHIGAAIANARAFEEIRVAGKRLEQANQSLERELAERREMEGKLRKSEQRYRRIVDTASEGIWELDERYTTTYVNRRMAEMLGYQPQEMVGKPVSEFLFEEDVASLPARITARRQGLTERYEQKYRRKDGSTLWMHVSAKSVQDDAHRFTGSFAMLMDITERTRAEDALRRLNRELRAISNCNQVLLRASDEQSLLQEICRIVCEEAGYRAAWVGYAEHDEARSVRPVAWTGIDGASLADLGITCADTDRGQGPVGTANRTGRTSYIADYATDPRVAPWREIALRHGFHSLIALPLTDEHASAFGSLNIYAEQPGAFAPQEIRLLEQLAADLAFGIVTLRSRAAREQAEQEVAILSFALDNVRDAAFLLDDKARCLYANEEACRSLGYTRAELLTLGVGDIDSEFPVERWSEHWLQLKAQRSMSFESRHRARDGRTFPVEVSANYFKYGGREYNLALVRDITERKRAEEALRRSEAYLAEGQRLSHTGSWAWSPLTLRGLYWSDELCRIYGLNPEEGLPTAETFWQRIHPEDLGPARELLMKAAQQSMHYEHEHRIVLPDGTVKHIHAIGHPVLDENGRLIEYVGTAIDVTERKRAEDELRKHRENLEDMVRHRTEQLAEAKARAEAANREKSRFLANMSHELRTPLNAILGFSRLLKSGPDVTPRQQEALDIIVRSGEHLLNLINNVLDMAKIESGGVALEESEADLHQLVHEIQSLMGVGAAEKGLRFNLERAPDLPRFVAVDASKLRQVLINLVGNAIKYTDAGGVKLRAGLTSQDGPERAHVRFEIEDSGPGIRQQDLHRIFFPFVQLGEQAPTRAGTGLGLAICKQYFELMGGQVGVASEPGKGSVFFFSIPVRVLPSVGEPDEPTRGRVLGLAEGEPCYRLLIVEDQAENRLLLRRLLDPLGFELREAVNGQEAVTLFEQWHPDLIWMDIRMPVMDGLEAVRRIRMTKAGASTKIIALTAHALEEERRPIMAAGCDDFVRKPFREQEIFDTLARHLRLKFIYEKTGHPESTPKVPEFAFSPEQLQALPTELLRDLRQAVIELDTARTQALIAQVTQRDASLGRALNTLATQLDYNRLFKVLEIQHSAVGQTL